MIPRSVLVKGLITYRNYFVNDWNLNLLVGEKFDFHLAQKMPQSHPNSREKVIFDAIVGSKSMD